MLARLGHERLRRAAAGRRWSAARGIEETAAAVPEPGESGQPVVAVHVGGGVQPAAKGARGAAHQAGRLGGDRGARAGGARCRSPRAARCCRRRWSRARPAAPANAAPARSRARRRYRDRCRRRPGRGPERRLTPNFSVPARVRPRFADRPGRKVFPERLVYRHWCAAYTARLPRHPARSLVRCWRVQQAFTFDDVLLVPGYSEVLPRDTELRSRLTRDIGLNIPFVSSAMDTVTESRLAIGIAQAGGIGIIHKNMTAEEQARQVRAVKKFESGVITDPVTVSPRASIRKVIELTREHDISGVPVVDGTELVGIVTNRDLRFETHHDEPVASVMTPKDKLVTVREGASRGEIRRLLHTHRIEKVLVVNGDFELRGPRDGQGHPEGSRVSRRMQGRARAAPGRRRGQHRAGYRRAGRGARRGGGRRDRRRHRARPLPGASSTGCARSSSTGRTCRSSAATSPPAEGAQALVAGGVCDAVKVGIGPGSILHYPRRGRGRCAAALGDRRSEPGGSREPGFRSSPTAESATPATPRRRSRRAGTR